MRVRLPDGQRVVLATHRKGGVSKVGVFRHGKWANKVTEIENILKKSTAYNNNKKNMVTYSAFKMTIHKVLHMKIDTVYKKLYIMNHALEVPIIPYH